MGYIEVRGIKMRAFHGCIEEEGLVGGDFTVDVRVKTPLGKPATTDRLADAVDYVAVSDLVRKSMDKRVNLIEKAAADIILLLSEKFPGVEEIEVWITKHRAPIEKNVSEVVVYLSSREIISTT